MTKPNAGYPPDWRPVQSFLPGELYLRLKALSSRVRVPVTQIIREGIERELVRRGG